MQLSSDSSLNCFVKLYKALAAASLIDGVYTEFICKRKINGNV